MAPTLEQFIESEEWCGTEGKLPDGSYKSTWDSIGGCWNIGPGLTKGITSRTVMTREQIDAAYAAELVPFEKVVASAVKVPLSGNERTALVSFAYNVGEGNFRSSTLLRVLNAGEYAAVPAQLKRWVHGRATGSKVIPGLVNRRNAEIEIWDTPEEPPYATVHPSEDVSTSQAPAYVPYYDPAHPVPKFATTLETTMSDAATLVNVPLQATTVIISQMGHKIVTASQGTLIAFVTYILTHFSSVWDLLGLNQNTVSIYAATAIIAAIEWWKHEWVHNSNDTTMVVVNSLEAELTKLKG